MSQMNATLQPESRAKNESTIDDEESVRSTKDSSLSCLSNYLFSSGVYFVDCRNVDHSTYFDQRLSSLLVNEERELRYCTLELNRAISFFVRVTVRIIL